MSKSNNPTTSQALLKARLDALIRAGSKAANCCYNLSQRESLDNREREVLKQACDAWDAAKKAITQ